MSLFPSLMSETNLVGVLVAEATGIHLADYLSEKIWRPYGMERDAEWMIRLRFFIQTPHVTRPISRSSNGCPAAFSASLICPW